MKLKLVRSVFTPHSTIGSLYVNGAKDRFCYTLEDCVRAVKIKGETAIPYGVYAVIVDMSQRFGRLMPHILDVPGFDGVRFHIGNTAADTEGCILVGMNASRDFISQSAPAFDSLFKILEEAGHSELEIVDEAGDRGVYM